MFHENAFSPYEFAWNSTTNIRVSMVKEEPKNKIFLRVKKIWRVPLCSRNHGNWSPLTGARLLESLRAEGELWAKW